MTLHGGEQPNLHEATQREDRAPGAIPARLKSTAEEYLPVGLVSAAIALVVVRWVGGATIYAGSALPARTLMHEAILANELPLGVASWDTIGSNGLNVRVTTVWLVEQVHLVSGLRTGVIYQMLDIVGIILGLILTYRLLRHWYPRELAISGTVLLGALLPLTMFLHNFHPWDKPAFVLWVGMILAAVLRQWPVFFVCYVLAVLIKFDAIFAAGIPLILFTTRREYSTPLALSAAAAIVGGGLLWMLTTLIPGGVEPRDLGAQLIRNLSTFHEVRFAYPPLLMHGLLFALGCKAWPRADELTKRLWLFGILLLIPHAVLTNFVEVRAQLGSAISMLPLAVLAFAGRRVPHGPPSSILTARRGQRGD